MYYEVPERRGPGSVWDSGVPVVVIISIDIGGSFAKAFQKHVRIDSQPPGGTMSRMNSQPPSPSVVHFSGIAASIQNSHCFSRTYLLFFRQE